MRKQMKFFKLFLVAIVAIVTYSCLDDPAEVEEIDYTPEREAAILSDYLDTLINRGYDIDTSEVGFYYVILEEGEGELVQHNDSIGIEYQGYRPDANVYFDASAYHYEDGVYKFKFASGNHIPGFDQALLLMNKGTEGVFIIPSSLAYGSTGQGEIPPYTTLVFQINLVDIYE